MPARYIPNAVVDIVSQSGRQVDRAYYDKYGRYLKQVSNGPHGNIKKHPFGKHGEHVHDFMWENGKIIYRSTRALTDVERKENGDIL